MVGSPWYIKPDIPFGIENAVLDAAYDDRVDVRNKLFTTHLLIAVSPKNKDIIRNAVPYDDLPQKTRLAVQMFSACARDWDRETEAFFDTIPNLSTGNAELKGIAKTLVEQARARGLSDEKAQAIRRQYDLPALAVSALNPQPRTPNPEGSAHGRSIQTQ